MSTVPVKLVVFRLGGHLFAAGIQAVERVVRYTIPSAVPDAPPWIEGVMEHAGKVVPVVDLRRRVELPGSTITATTRILILSTSGGVVGAIVDAVLEVATVKPDGIVPPPALFSGLASEFITGVARIRDQLVVVLDVDRVLTSADRLRFDDAPRDDGVSAGV